MSYFAYERYGATLNNPSPDDLERLLESLKIDDDEHPDVSVTHESGWCVSAFASGLVCLENVETGDGPWHVSGLSAADVLELWGKLTSGDIVSLRSADWLPGYGSCA